jgi:hypothetical protein
MPTKFAVLWVPWVSPKNVFPLSHEVKKKTLKRANAEDLRMGHVKSNRSMASKTTETSVFSGANEREKIWKPIIYYIYIEREFPLEHDQAMRIIHIYSGIVIYVGISSMKS